MEDNNYFTPQRRPKKLKLNNTPQGFSKRFRGLSNSTPKLKFLNLPAATQSSQCESPPLPCNQVEYLCDSESSFLGGEIPCSPGILDTSLRNISNWDSFIASKSNTTQVIVNEKCMQEKKNCDNINKYLKSDEAEDHGEITLISEQFKSNIEESFNIINKSLSKKNDLSSLFETKDSFLLDIRESGIVLDQTQTKENESVKPCINVQNKSSTHFYGLPVIVRGLFKTYRNIEKFYDWQEECLNLNAIKERRNLIYALPTSGGKTLVAEVLMLREVLNRKHNVLFILPFVAIVQEKIWALSPFALQLDFLLEEYAGGKGHIPPKKRRKKNSIYIATIEKGLALVRSLIEENRLHELGLIVVDELHLIGEPGRGGTLEMLLTTVIFANKGIQIVGMSATIGNLPDIAQFLRAEVFERQFRPVELTEYVKLGDMLHRIVWGKNGVEIVPDRQLDFDYSAAGSNLDPDRLGGLVAEVVPQTSCLVFCPTKRNCENVAALLCKLQRREMVSHQAPQRAALAAALRAEGAAELARAAACGVAYHHAGLANDERLLLEQAFRSGVISVLCCTSTLAAGVNLPAGRVILRAPRVGREPLSLSAYKQMVGRAGRAGVTDKGESIIICTEREWAEVRQVFESGMPGAASVLQRSVPALLLSAVALRLATTRARLRDLLQCTLLAVTATSSSDLKSMCDESLRGLLQGGALEAAGQRPADCHGDYYVHDTALLAVSKLGQAAIKGCMELETAQQVLREIEAAARGLVLLDSLHLLFLVTTDTSFTIDYVHYYHLYSALDEEAVHTARAVGLTENNAIRMLTGKPITNVRESVLRRFYLALMLRDLWRQMPVPAVANKYCVPRGTVQAVMASASSFAASAARLCHSLAGAGREHRGAVAGRETTLWSFALLLEQLAVRLRHCASPELHDLMELPGVKKARAMQLVRGGFKRVEDIAKAAPQQLAATVTHLSLTAANHLISAARIMLIEKVENLRAEAEEVMEELNVPATG